MSDMVRLVAFLEETWSRFVVPLLGDTILQLHEWTGEFPASASGAPPPSSAPPPGAADPDAPVEPPVRLTKVEADAENPDRARVALVRVYEIVDAMVIASEGLSRSTVVTVLHEQVESVPPPGDEDFYPEEAS